MQSSLDIESSKADSAAHSRQTTDAASRTSSFHTTTNERDRVLLVDDDAAYAMLLGELLGEVGVAVDFAQNWQEMEQALLQRQYAMVVLDLRLPDGDSLDRLSDLVSRLPRTPILIATACNNVAISVEAMRRGASSYVTKSLDGQAVLGEILRVLPQQPGSGADSRSAQDTVRELGLLGESRRFLQAIEESSRFALVDSTVLLLGESGTGKERFAHAIHQLSARRNEPFVAVNCGAIPDNLLESQLFGHRRGAFTDARSDQHGLFAAAGRGTLLLDEIGDMPLRLQVKLLRVLQEREFTPLGADNPEPLRARILAATNQPLERGIAQGTFREDLYFRLSVLRLEIPALRDRREDIPLLVRQCIDRCNARFGRSVAYPSSDVMARLATHRWNGNVRELQNTMERAVALAPEGRIELRHLFPSGEIHATSAAEHAATHGTVSFAEAKRLFELEYLSSILRDCGGNLAEAARRSGLHRPQLYRLLGRHGLGRNA